MANSDQMSVEKIEQFDRVVPQRFAVLVEHAVKDFVGVHSFNQNECHCLAYCLKVSFLEFPQVREEFLVSFKTHDSIVYLAYFSRVEGDFRLAKSPTHNVDMECIYRVNNDFESELITFLDKTTFGFFDFEIADREMLYIAPSLEKVLVPISNKVRRGRIGYFVAPGP